MYPAGVENLIYSFPNVQQTVVFAIPDPKWGQMIGAAVVSRQGHAIAPKELLISLRGNLANFKVPQTIPIRESTTHIFGKVTRAADTLLSS